MTGNIPVHLDKPRYNRVEAAEYIRWAYGLRCTAGTLNVYAVAGKGPRFLKAGRWPVYLREALDAYAHELMGLEYEPKDKGGRMGLTG